MFFGKAPVFSASFLPVRKLFDVNPLAIPVQAGMTFRVEQGKTNASDNVSPGRKKRTICRPSASPNHKTTRYPRTLTAHRAELK